MRWQWQRAPVETKPTDGHVRLVDPEELAEREAAAGIKPDSVFLTSPDLASMHA